MEGVITIFIKTLVGTTYEFKIDKATETIGSLKERIINEETKTKLYLNQLELLFNS
jgi:hypothetical protein